MTRSRFTKATLAALIAFGLGLVVWYWRTDNRPAHQPIESPESSPRRNVASAPPDISAREAGDILTGKVVALSDGDTVTVLDPENVQHRVRLQGIDAPESNQAFGTVSRQHLAELVFGKEVSVRFDKLDRYDRAVGKVTIDGRDVGLEQVKAGLAWHYKEYEREQSDEERHLYAEAEQQARAEGLGLWQDKQPTPPWEYRNGQRSATAPTSTPAVIAPPAAGTAAGPILGNRRSGIYHWPGCPNYDDISPQNRVPFGTREEAERAGYRAARNCP